MRYTNRHFTYLLTYFMYSVFGTSLLWRSTVAFTYLKVKSTKFLCLLPVVLVLVLRIWSCLHHCHIHEGLEPLQLNSWIEANSIALAKCCRVLRHLQHFISAVSALTSALTPRALIIACLVLLLTLYFWGAGSYRRLHTIRGAQKYIQLE